MQDVGCSTGFCRNVYVHNNVAEECYSNCTKVNAKAINTNYTGAVSLTTHVLCLHQTHLLVLQHT